MGTLPPQQVGSRELKTRLGTYLRQVQKGAVLIVTDRGRPVAELRPLEQRPEGVEERFQELARRGVVGGEVRQRQPLEWFEPIQNRGGLLSDAVNEDREERF